MNEAPVVVFGAGSIGRGLLGQLLAGAQWPVVFVEPVEPLREALRQAKTYTVRLTGRRPEVFTVNTFDVLGPDDEETLRDALAQCPFAATAVGGPHLASVAGILARVFPNRKAVMPLLLCENWPDAAGEMSRYLAAQGITAPQVACVASSVERMLRPGNGLELVGESCETLLIDGHAWPGEPPRIPGFQFVEDLAPYYKRKLFTNNAGHVLLAYEGALKGCATLTEALGYADIAVHVQELLDVAAAVLHRHYGLEPESLAEHVENLMQHRYANPALGDTVQRVGRQPLRKLGPDERLTGLLNLAIQYGLDIEPICRTMAAAMHYQDPEDEECARMAGMIQSGGPGEVLENVCKLTQESKAFERIVAWHAQWGE